MRQNPGNVSERRCRLNKRMMIFTLTLFILFSYNTFAECICIKNKLDFVYPDADR